MTEQDWTGRTMVMSGGSRGIGLAIALGAAKRGANVVLLAKTGEPDPRLPGTVHTAAAEIEAAGGHAHAVVGDVRSEEDVQLAIDEAVQHFGGIDFCVNNASAINLLGTVELPVKRFDLMQQVNVRGTFLLTRACVPHLRNASNPHILTLSPPIGLKPEWLGGHPAYTLAKYGMSLLTLGWAEEFRSDKIAANCLWPRTIIATAAVQNLLGGDEAMSRARTPEIVADAAVEILSRPSTEATANTYIDTDVLAEAGITDLSKYGGGPDLATDLFVEG